MSAPFPVKLDHAEAVATMESLVRERIAFRAVPDTADDTAWTITVPEDGLPFVVLMTAEPNA